jgi:phosphotransferase system  glucose/maltose/N-acetylglucosamine-specific IIC component
MEKMKKLDGFLDACGGWLVGAVVAAMMAGWYKVVDAQSWLQFFANFGVVLVIGTVGQLCFKAIARGLSRR